MHNVMWIDGMKNYGLQCSGTPEFVQEFQNVVVGIETEWEVKDIFYQGSTNNWKFIEFWTKDMEFILCFCGEVEERMGMEIKFHPPSREDLGL